MQAIQQLTMVVCIMMSIFTTGCTDKGPETQTPVASPAPTETTKVEGTTNPTTVKNPVVTIEMEDGGMIKAELYPNIAPNTVANYISLIQAKKYDGVIFHRVIPGFMIQGGDPQGTGMGGPGYSIPGEFSGNGFKNDLKHTRGVLSMARSGNPNSGGSQFFVMAKEYPSLDGQYAAFGKVLDEESLKVVDKIVGVQRDQSDKPLKPQTMKKVTVDTFGVTYPAPKKSGE
ncbi:MAG: peptidylprolyl isomerase [Hyphomonadaceae bacterium]|nr:peptidylprolyl isomerase [Clostridia bacterium]